MTQASTVHADNGPRDALLEGGVPFVRPDVPDYAAVAAAFEASMSSGLLTKGPQLERLEREAAEALGVSHALGLSSCTVGLALVLKALMDRGRERTSGPLRDEVVMPSFVFLASPAAAVWAGMRPVFVEICPKSWTVDSAAVEAAIGPRTRAILACHTFGNPCDEPRLEEIAQERGIDLVVDAAHGFGSLAEGQPVGSRGIAQVFSMSPTKLVVAGEGGIVATGDADLAARLLDAREYGNDGRYGSAAAGLNGRLPELSAALARASLKRLEKVRAARVAAAEAFREGLAGLPGIALQQIAPGRQSSWKDFAVRVEEAAFGRSRDDLRELLLTRGVDTRAYYSPPCHAMQAYAEFQAGRPPLPETEKLAAECLALPMGRHVTPEVATAIAGIIAEAAQ